MSSRRHRETDVLILGGGPAGATLAAVLLKYNRGLRVTVVEKALYPRHHIGESLVLEVNRVLQDSGALPAVERAGFLKKGGATYVWGENRRPWSFWFRESTGRRPHFEGIQDYTWHVDRSRFDTLLLEHARACGAEVLQPARATRLRMDGERVTGATLEMGGAELEISARFVVDASGRAGVVARRFGTRVFDPLRKNVATFGYWQGAALEPEYTLSWDEAAIAIVTLPIGWLWYIPMHKDVVSVGAVTDVTRFRELTRDGVEAHYLRALQSAPEPKRWLSNATLVDFPGAPRKVMVESDFNYLHSQLHGPGWALVGDAAGFVDPLFTFGVFLAVTGAQMLGYVLGTLLDGRYPGATEERLLGAYEGHVRSYYDAFSAMVNVFYGFNSSKEAFWAQTRELLRGHALPKNVADRDAFMAFTFGYGVNSLLVHEATQHFGSVALRRIRDMCLEPEADISLSDPGDYAPSNLPRAARPRLLESYQVGDTVIPVPGSGRVVPMARVEIGSAATGAASSRFPRYFFLPDELVPLLKELDGTRTVQSLLDQVVAERSVRLAGGKTPEQLVEHVLRCLDRMGALDFEGARPSSPEALAAR